MKRKLYVAASAAAVLVVAAALTVILWPSGSGRDADGPLGRSAPTDGAECIPIPGWVITYGFEGVLNSGSAPAVVQKIGYVHPHNLKVLAAYLVPNLKGYLYGGRSGYPPKWMLTHRRMTVPPVKIMSAYTNVILVTKLTGPVGHADAVYLDYEENGNLYSLRTTTSLTLNHGSHTGTCRV